MLIKSALPPEQLHQFVHQYRQHFTEAEQKFLLNMLVACDLDQDISQKQWAWLSALIHKMGIIARMQQHTE